MHFHDTRKLQKSRNSNFSVQNKGIQFSNTVRLLGAKVIRIKIINQTILVIVVINFPQLCFFTPHIKVINFSIIQYSYYCARYNNLKVLLPKDRLAIQKIG